MAIAFELTTDADVFKFDAFDTNGNKVLSSAPFGSKSVAEQAIQDVRLGSMMSEHISVGTEPGGKFFTIRNGAGQVLVKSVTYESELDFNYALHAFREGACIAELDDKTTGD